MSPPPGEPPRVVCPGIDVPGVELAPVAAFEPLVSFLSSRSSGRETKRFSRGMAFADGRLDLCKQGLGVRGLERVLDATQGHPWIEHLLLGTNALGDEGAAVLAGALERGLPIHTVYAGCNGIVDVRPLASALAPHKQVRALWLKRNPVDRAALRVLLESVAHSNVRTLDLTNCALGDEGCAEVADGLADTPIEALYLGGNGLSSAAPLARLLARTSSRLAHLYLGASRLGGGEAAKLLEVLPIARSLRTLDLASNGLTAEDVRELGRCVAGSNLTVLSFGTSRAAKKLGEHANGLGDETVPSLAAAMTGLASLDLRGTSLTSRGAKVLLAARDTRGRQTRLLFGSGIARTLRRGGALGEEPEDTATTGNEDARFIRSVYR